VASERHPDFLWWHGVLQTDEHQMSFLAARNAIGIGLGGIISLFGVAVANKPKATFSPNLATILSKKTVA
jgi:hypothetical protein